MHTVQVVVQASFFRLETFPVAGNIHIADNGFCLESEREICQGADRGRNLPLGIYLVIPPFYFVMCND